MLSIYRENWVESLKNIGHRFDFSNLDEDNPLYSTKNRNVLGMFKVETKNARILGRGAKKILVKFPTILHSLFNILVAGLYFIKNKCDVFVDSL